MRSRLLLAALASLAIISAALATVIVQRVEAPDGTGQALIGGPFTLTDDTGKRVTETSYAGRFTLVYFGYTACPDICPLGLQVISQALDDVPSGLADKIVPLFVTVDPGRDTPTVMHEYLTSFRPGMVGLTGSTAEIDAMAKTYRVYLHRPPEGERKPGYLVDHTSITYLMDQDGRYVTHFSYGITPEDLAKRLAALVPTS